MVLEKSFESDILNEGNEVSSLEMLLKQHAASMAVDDSKPLGPHKYRIQLLEAMREIVGAVEPRNRIFVELFLRFIR